MLFFWSFIHLQTFQKTHIIALLLKISSKITGVCNDNTSLSVLPLIPWLHGCHECPLQIKTNQTNKKNITDWFKKVSVKILWLSVMSLSRWPSCDVLTHEKRRDELSSPASLSGRRSWGRAVCSGCQLHSVWVSYRSVLFFPSLVSFDSK